MEAKPEGGKEAVKREGIVGREGGGRPLSCGNGEFFVVNIAMMNGGQIDLFNQVREIQRFALQ